MKTLFIGIRAAIFMSGFILVWAWLILAIRPFDRQIGWAPPAALAFAGPVLMLAGAALALLCGGLFVVRGRGTPALFDAPRRFVAVGPYRFMRNPMYVGALLFVAGLALYWRSASLVASVPAIFVIAHLLVTLYEEPVLSRKFGVEYERYCASVPRWPWFRSHACPFHAEQLH